MIERKQDPAFCPPFECFRLDSATAGDLFPVVNQSHYFSEILLVRSGVCRIIRGTREHILRSGELIYIASLVPHTISSADGNPVAFDVVKYSATRLKEIPPYLKELRSLSAETAQVRAPVQMSAENVKAYHMDRIIDECLYVSKRNDSVSDLHIRALIYLLITGLARFWIDNRDTYARLLAQAHNPVLDIPAYIEEHIAEPLKVEDLAARCDLSYPWFAKRFHDYFGISCKQCIEKLRTETVERYLTYSDLNLADISSRTGYTDCSHMVKDFRRMTGMTPGQYRSSMKIQGFAPFSRFSAPPAPIHPPKG